MTGPADPTPRDGLTEGYQLIAALAEITDLRDRFRAVDALNIADLRAVAVAASFGHDVVEQARRRREKAEAERAARANTSRWARAREALLISRVALLVAFRELTGRTG